MVAGLTKCGPTVLLIKDTKGHVFGGFASHAWEIKPQFQGERELCMAYTTQTYTVLMLVLIFNGFTYEVNSQLILHVFTETYNDEVLETEPFSEL